MGDGCAIKIFADSADVAEMARLRRAGLVKGFTTNPTLMRAAGVSDYEAFAHAALEAVPDLPISFEIFSDQFEEMAQQARRIASWGPNVYVKIPVTNTIGDSSAAVIGPLSREGIRINVTAVFTPAQVEQALESLCPETPSVISIFAGRIANAGVDPMPIITCAVEMARAQPACEILWASPREAFNVLQAQACGCQIITLTGDLLSALTNFGKSLEQYSLETVRMFYDDARAAGYFL